VGLVIAAVVAAAMSTLSSSLNSSATALVADFYQPWFPDRGERHYLRASRGLTIFWGVAQTGVALAAFVVLRDQPGSIVNHVFAVAGIAIGMVLGLFLLGSLAEPIHPRAALAGLLTGFVVVLAVWLPVASSTVLQLWTNVTGLERPLAWPWYAPLGAGLTFVVAVVLQRLVYGHGSPRNGKPPSGVNAPG
jgi:Na+/proline symporter